jgi:hypothetical protein
MKINLDHVGFLGSDIERMVSVFTALGFHVTGPATFRSNTQGSGNPASVQRSAHIVFQGTYIELTSVSPCGPGHHLAAYQGLDEGVRLLILNSGNADRARADLLASGCAVSDVQGAARKLTYGAGEIVGFRWFSAPPETVPDTLTAWVEHLNAAAIFDSKVMQHPNTVTGITVLLHRSGLLPGIVEDDQGKVLLEEDQRAPMANVFFTGLELAAQDIQLCAGLLRGNAVPFQLNQGVIEVPASHAAGARLRIRGLK